MALLLEKLLYLVLVGLLWYVVSIEIDGKGLSVLTPKTRMRRTADVLAVFFGVAVANTGLLIRRYEFGFVTTYSTLVATPYFIWAVTIVVFYGHDLWACLDKARKGKNHPC